MHQGDGAEQEPGWTGMEGSMMKDQRYLDKRNGIFLYAVTFILMAVMGCFLNVAVVLDETGVVANAAYIAGNNWHEWVRATGGYYYKYGSSLLYIPIMAVFNNPYIIYKLILVVNAALIAVVPVCAYRILWRHLKTEDRKLCVYTAFAVGIVPSSILFSLSAKADVALIVWGWVLLLVMLECVEETNAVRQIIFSVLTAAISVYMYMCHTRGIVFVIATFMTVFVMRFVLRKRAFRFLPYICSLVLCMLLDKKLTRYFKTNIWGLKKLKNTADSIKIEKYKKIPTFTGARTLIRNVSGWFTNSITGTYGFVIAGFFAAICILFLYFKLNKKDVSKQEHMENIEISDKEVIISLFGLLVFVGTMALGVLFFFSVNFKFTAGYTASRMDRFFYSRYMSPGYAILILIALYYLFIKKNLFGKKMWIFLAGFDIAMIGLTGIWTSRIPERVGFSWRNALDAGLLYFPARFGNDGGAYESAIVVRALLSGAVFAFAVFMIILFIGYYNRDKYALPICLVILCFLGTLCPNYIKLKFNADMRTMNGAGEVLTAVETMVDQYKELPDDYPNLYYDATDGKGYKYYQMGFPNFNVRVKSKAKFEEMDNALIVVRTHVVNEKWMGEDCYLLKDYDYDNSINAVIVKGNELKEALRQHGIDTVDMPEGYGEAPVNNVPEDYWQAVRTSFSYQWESFIR